MQGRCSYSLLPAPAAYDRLTALLLRSGSLQSTNDVPLHKRLKIAFAACPNACTLPQIKDVGFIAELSPRRVLDTCTQCGRCVALCREQAVTMAGGPPQFDHAHCVACGMCVRQCPQDAIQSGPLRFAVLIGGRMGRHPRFADRLCTVHEHNLPVPMEKLLAAIDTHPNGKRFADLIDHTGLPKLKEQILHA